MTEARDAHTHHLGALAVPAIHGWLRESGVEEASWESVIRASSGYPLFIDDAIRLVRGGFPIENLKAPARFESLLRESWNRLSPQLMLVVTKLAGFDDPPDDSFLSSYLHLDPLALSTLKRQLVYAGVFVRRPDGIEWFHERRRTYIWGTILSTGDRSLVGAEVMAVASDWLEAQEHIPFWLPSALPSLTRGLDLSARDPDTNKLLALSRDQLAILWALIEAVEPDENGGMFIEMRELVQYASLRAGFGLDPLAAIEGLVSSELVVTSANEHVSIIGMVSSSPLHYALLIGEITRLFRRRPRPRLARVALEFFIRRYIQPFKMSLTALGEGSLATHRRALDQINKKDTGYRDLSRTPALGVDITLDDYPITTTVTFDSSQERDAALANLRNQPDLGAQVRLKSVITLPPERVKFGRYTSVLRMLHLENSEVEVRDPAGLMAYIQRRLDAIVTLRGVMSSDDGDALGMSEYPRYLVEPDDAPHSWIEYEVLGSCRPSVDRVELSVEKPRFSDPLLELRLRGAGHLKPGERVGSTHATLQGSGRVAHPLREVIESIHKRGLEFNKGLARVTLEPNEKVLSDAIRSERATRLTCLRRLHDAGLIQEVPVSNSSLYIALWHQGQLANDPSWIDPWMAATYEVEDEAGAVVVRVLADDSDLPWFHPTTEELSPLGIDDASLVRRSGSGSAGHVLAELLGYVSDDVWVIDPSSPFAKMLR